MKHSKRSYMFIYEAKKFVLSTNKIVFLYEPQEDKTFKYKFGSV